MGSVEAGATMRMAGTTSATPVPTAKPVTFRNSRFYVVFLALTSLLCWCLVPLAALMTLSLFLPPFDWSFSRIYGIASWLLLVYFFAAMGQSLWHLCRRMAFYTVRLDATGVAFRLGTKAQPVEPRLLWDEIAAIHYKQLPSGPYYSVVRKDGASVEWTSYTFLRAKKLAALVSARQEIGCARFRTLWEAH